MGYDEHLAQRVRTLLQDETDVTEKKMFGGLAFLLAGHMAVAVGQDGLMFRIEPGTGPARSVHSLRPVRAKRAPGRVEACARSGRGRSVYARPHALRLLRRPVRLR